MEQDDYVYPGQRFTENGYCTGQGQGMTLRDWFAGMALQAAWEARDKGYFEGEDNDMANCAYQLADAMLEARKK